MKIPANAKKVFTGIIFNVYQWEQELYDGSKSIFEGIKRKDTVQILPVVGEKILLSFEEQPQKPLGFNFFGGQIEKGEEPLAAAKRELLEEAGLTARTWELYKVYEAKGKTEWLTYFYFAKDCEEVKKQNLDKGEKIKVKEVTFEKFLEIASDESFWNTTITNDILRMRINRLKLQEFRRRIFMMPV